eukprot:MONOS_14607.2-p1 / transcript=MONOS_14607.2 / gene=MONOS_14607 / organism=Monocercomonoides_exilis_PA203 / gene_product=Lysosomal acid phosphatase / transcript_product=Lysosomal acid phosphatase / location=Mono_scaffold01034:16399-18061(-) / protein_length=415 / sequence_SO=supercontig / SO=protein_coding / is_pseudo=false
MAFVDLLRFLSFLRVVCVMGLGSAELVSVTILTRHGDRTPYANLAGLTQWAQNGVLTERGMEQLYVLGQTLRAHYGAFLPAEYSGSAVHVRSSDVERCLMSTWSLHAGLFPHKAQRQAGAGQKEAGEGIALPEVFQTVPIETVPGKEEYLLKGYSACAVTERLFGNWMKTEEAAGILKKYEEARAEAKARYGVEIDFATVEDVVDAMNVEVEHNTEKATEELKVLLGKLEGLQHEGRKFYFAVNNTLWKQATLGKLFEEIFSVNPARTAEALEAEPARPHIKLHHYSAHDTTLDMVLRGLGHVASKIPYYGSVVIVELHRRSGGGSSSSSSSSSSNSNGVGKGSKGIKGGEYFFKFFFQEDQKKAGTEELWAAFQPVQCKSMECPVEVCIHHHHHQHNNLFFNLFFSFLVIGDCV